MAKIIWTNKAFGQLERAINYIRKEQGLSYAEIVLNKILEKITLLESSPEMGALEPLLSHKKTEYRFLIVWSFKIIYRFSKDQITISRIFHTSRNPSKLKGI